MKVRNLVKGIATALAIALIAPCAVFNNRVYADTNTGIQTFVTSLYSDCLRENIKTRANKARVSKQ